MPIEKRFHTIEDFFKKKQKSNKHDPVSDASDDSPDLTDFQVNNSFNHNTLKINSQTTTTSDGCFDMCAVSRSIEDILGSVERADDDTCTMPSTAGTYTYAPPQL